MLFSTAQKEWGHSARNPSTARFSVCSPSPEPVAVYAQSTLLLSQDHTRIVTCVVCREVIGLTARRRLLVRERMNIQQCWGSSWVAPFFLGCAEQQWKNSDTQIHSLLLVLATTVTPASMTQVINLCQFRDQKVLIWFDNFWSIVNRFDITIFWNTKNCFCYDL